MVYCIFYSEHFGQIPCNPFPSRNALLRSTKMASPTCMASHQLGARESVAVVLIVRSLCRLASCWKDRGVRKRCLRHCCSKQPCIATFTNCESICFFNKCLAGKHHRCFSSYVRAYPVVVLDICGMNLELIHPAAERLPSVGWIMTMCVNQPRSRNSASHVPQKGL